MEYCSTASLDERRGWLRPGVQGMQYLRTLIMAWTLTAAAALTMSTVKLCWHRLSRITSGLTWSLTLMTGYVKVELAYIKPVDLYSHQSFSCCLVQFVCHARVRIITLNKVRMLGQHHRKISIFWVKISLEKHGSGNMEESDLYC